MSTEKQKVIGVLTSGGDCPGLNAVLRGVVCAANNLGWKVIGFYDGYEGLLEHDKHIELTLQNTEGIMQRGGTILGTTNRGHFVSKTGPNFPFTNGRATRRIAAAFANAGASSAADRTTTARSVLGT